MFYKFTAPLKQELPSTKILYVGIYIEPIFKNPSRTFIVPQNVAVFQIKPGKRVCFPSLATGMTLATKLLNPCRTFQKLFVSQAHR